MPLMCLQSDMYLQRGAHITPRNVVLVQHTTLKHRASHGLDGVRHVTVHVLHLVVPHRDVATVPHDVHEPSAPSRAAKVEKK